MKRGMRRFIFPPVEKNTNSRLKPPPPHTLTRLKTQSSNLPHVIIIHNEENPPPPQRPLYIYRAHASGCMMRPNLLSHRQGMIGVPSARSREEDLPYPYRPTSPLQQHSHGFLTLSLHSPHLPIFPRRRPRTLIPNCNEGFRLRK